LIPQTFGKNGQFAKINSAKYNFFAPSTAKIDSAIIIEEK